MSISAVSPLNTLTLPKLKSIRIELLLSLFLGMKKAPVKECFSLI
jgi:hypothetical protein